MLRALGWIGIIVTVPPTLFLTAITISFIADGSIGEAFIGWILTLIPAALAIGSIWLIRHPRKPKNQVTPRMVFTPTTAPTPHDAPPLPMQHQENTPHKVATCAQQLAPAPTPDPANCSPLVFASPGPITNSRRKRGPARGKPGLTLAYAEHGGTEHTPGPYAVVDVETTGFSADNGDRIIEVAVVRIDEYGIIEDEWATLINPGRDTEQSTFTTSATMS